MPDTHDPRLAIAGLLIGILAGMTGMGGGSLMTPILILFFKFDPAIAVGTDILHGAVFKSFGAVRHRQLGTVRLRLGLWMLVGSAPMSLVGVWTVGFLTDRYGDGVDSVQGKILACTLIVGGLAFLAKAIMHPAGPQKELGHLSNRDRFVAISIGAVGGFVVGLTSVGSGTLFGLAMLIAFPLSAKIIVGTDIFHAAALLWVAGVGHLVAGNVDVPAIGWLLLGSIPGVLIGSQISVNVPDRLLRFALATALILSGIKLLGIPYANQIVVASLIVGLGALAVWGIVHRFRRRPPSPSYGRPSSGGADLPGPTSPDA